MEREDPADTTERRDFDLPPDAGESAPEPAEAPDGPAAGKDEPADESEKRDWDMP